MVIKLNSIEQFEQTIQDHDKVFVMKHSLTCPISLNAYDQFNNFLYERDMDGYYLTVQEARELSNYIAEKTGIKHESPQVFYFVDQQVAWHDSHNHITVSSLSAAEE
ncbi:bacillithiol system redox-active protein YtxJ [Macrococcus brunensis]|uniref:Bacillithiol system redox-active protein YtxJ n=1 Tax=Macrococcus brunensis TaxID=198483 RepID=A0A4R6BGA9_9STAP|nr:bacillithiol system redox-active protein YtxJ [Macrococcus brunensis]TDL98937.1 bacillithiol system redox-active protein YtxJ [Macrococcus brunensis]ULG72526.1 bacillithiol system redox-active protein YtxJ [Macrococcus brunensis]